MSDKPKAKDKLRGSGTVYQRGGRWWIRYWFRGKPFSESAGDSEKEATAKLKKRLADVWRGERPRVEEDRLTVADLVEAYVRHLTLAGKKAVGTIASHADTIREALGIVRIADLTADRIDEYISERRQTASPRRPGQLLAPATINRETEVLRAALRLAWKRGEISRVPWVTRLEENNARRVLFAPAEFETFLPHLEPEGLRDAAEFSYLVGWRKGVVLPLPWTRVNWNAEPHPEVALEEGVAKEGEARSVPLVGRLLDLMQRRFDARTVTLADGTARISPYVFHNGQGERFADPRLAWRRALTAAGLGHKVWHDLKRSANTNLTNAGNAPARVMKVTGHKSDVMYRRYLLTEQAEKAETLVRTFAYLEEQKGKRTVVPMRKRGGGPA